MRDICRQCGVVNNALIPVTSWAVNTLAVAAKIVLHNQYTLLIHHFFGQPPF